MAEFKLNDGNPVDLFIPSAYNQATIYISVDIIPDNDVIKLAGRTFIKCIGIDNKDVIFSGHPLATADNLYNKELYVKVDATKFKVKDTDLSAADIPVTCTLTVRAGRDRLEQYSLDDRKDCTINSVFIFKIVFRKGS